MSESVKTPTSPSAGEGGRLPVEADGRADPLTRVEDQAVRSVWEAAELDAVPGAEVRPPVFVSYASPERERLVRPLVDWLRRAGLSVWYDWGAIRTGDAWKRRIEAGLRKCSLMLATLTPTTVDPPREWVLYEHERARFGFFAPLLPIILEDCPHPAHLKDLQYRRLLPADFSADGVARYRDADLLELLEDIRARLLPRGMWVADGTPPPPVGRSFVGRGAELRELIGMMRYGEVVEPDWEPTESPVVIHGVAGMGKTMLVEELARRIGPRFPGGVLFEKRGRNPRESEQDVLRRWAGGRAVSRPEQVSSHLRRAGRLLVVIDDVWPEDFDTVKTLCGRALPPDNCDRLLTTRFAGLKNKVGGRVLRLLRLSEDDGVLLLEDRLRDKGPMPPREVLVALWQAVGGHTLALELAAGRCGDNARLPGQVGDLERALEEGRLDPLTANVFKHEADTNLAISFQQSLEALRAAGGERGELLASRFAELGVFAEEAPFDAEAAAAVWDVERDAAERLLDELGDHALLRPVLGKGTFEQHPLLHVYAAGLLRDQAGRFEELAARHLEHFTSLVERFRGSRWREFDVQAENIALAGRRASELLPAKVREGLGAIEPAGAVPPVDEAAARRVLTFACSAANYVWRRRVHAGEEWLRAGLAAARVLGDRRNEARMLTELGVWLNERGRRREAIACLRRALALWKALWRESQSADDGKGVTWALGNLGVVYRAIDRPRKALRIYGLCLPIQEQLGDLRGKAITLGCIGVAYRDLGEHEKTLDYCRQGLEISRQREDGLGQGIGLNNIGRAYRDLGRFDEAMATFDEAMPLAQAEGNEVGLGILLNNRGNVLSDQGEHEDALALFEEAARIQRRARDWARVAVCRHNAGSAQHALGRRAEALASLAEALKLENEVDDYAGRASTLYALAMARFDADDAVRLQPAVSALRNAIRVLESRSLDRTSAGTSLEQMRRLLANWEAGRLAPPPLAPTI